MIGCVLDLDGLVPARLDVLFGWIVAGSFRWIHRFAGDGSRPCSMMDSRSCYSDDDVAVNQRFAGDGVVYVLYRRLLVISLEN